VAAAAAAADDDDDDDDVHVHLASRKMSASTSK